MCVRGGITLTTLFRQFLIIQILLISLVGLGGPAITNINSIIGGLTSLKATETQVSADTGRAIDPNGSSEFSARVAKFDIYAKNSSIFALVLVGFGLSWGAFIQSKRLFINCKKFVKRAAAIEVKFSLGTLSLDGDKDILPVNQYMNNRLSDPEQDDFQMQTALSIVYLYRVCTMVFHWGDFNCSFCSINFAFAHFHGWQFGLIRHVVLLRWLQELLSEVRHPYFGVPYQDKESR